MTLLAATRASLCALALSGVLAACSSEADLAEKPDPIGSFRLGHAVVVAREAQKGPLSREASQEELESTLKAALERRLQRYDGDKWYHVAVSVDGYILAVPGVPLVASPRSALILGLEIWDDELGAKITEEAAQLIIVEEVSGSSLVGSGLTQSAEQQLERLSRAAARRVEDWLVENGSLFGGEDRVRPPEPSGT